jgi:hypothetical protein
MRVQFISTEYVYRYTLIEDNVDPDLIKKNIYVAQDLNIQQVLGQNLYTKLVNDLPNFVGQYQTLVIDYLQPCLAEWVVYYTLPYLNYRFTNKAVSTKSSDNSQPSTIEDIKWLRDQVRNNAEFYSERMRDYIKNNLTLFPEFYFNDLSFSIKPSVTNYFSGIYTSGRRFRAPYPPLNNIDPNDFGCCD